MVVIFSCGWLVLCGNSGSLSLLSFYGWLEVAVVAMDDGLRDCVVPVTARVTHAMMVLQCGCFLCSVKRQAGWLAGFSFNITSSTADHSKFKMVFVLRHGRLQKRAPVPVLIWTTDNSYYNGPRYYNNYSLITINNGGLFHCDNNSRLGCIDQCIVCVSCQKNDNNFYFLQRYPTTSTQRTAKWELPQ